LGVPPEPDPSDALDPSVVVGLLAEPGRLRAVAALALGAATLPEVAAAGGLPIAGALRALDRLVAGGLVDLEDGGGRYRLRVERLAATARESARARPRGVEDESISADAREVLRNFVVDGRLTAIPVVRSKRLVVLDYLAGRFEPGKIYPERDVNFLLGTAHPDYAALRRYLVDDGFLERRDGFYWRAGGSFEVN
jgi:hypothetical protein